MTLSRVVGTILTFAFPSCLRAHGVLTTARPLRRPFSSWFGQALGCLLLMAVPLFAANHPAITGKNANCALCHADMTQGKSVHSQGELGCGLCHSSAGDGKTVEMLLTVPKEQICFVCHERAIMQQHVSSSTNKDCLGCHDAHRSERAMLLRRNVDMNYASTPVPTVSKHPNTATKLKSHGSGERHSQHPQPTDHKM